MTKYLILRIDNIFEVKNAIEKMSVKYPRIGTYFSIEKEVYFLPSYLIKERCFSSFDEAMAVASELNSNQR